jgi:hypothetical protein
MLSMEIFDNRLIILGVMVEIFLAGVINYSWLGNFLLDTAPIPSALWGLARLNISHYLGKLATETDETKAADAAALTGRGRSQIGDAR